MKQKNYHEYSRLCSKVPFTVPLHILIRPWICAQVQPGSGGQFSGIAICAKNPSFTNGAYYVMPQFQVSTRNAQ
jgi:hypothetical protein